MIMPNLIQLALLILAAHSRSLDLTIVVDRLKGSMADSAGGKIVGENHGITILIMQQIILTMDYAKHGKEPWITNENRISN